MGYHAPRYEELVAVRGELNVFGGEACSMYSMGEMEMDA